MNKVFSIIFLCLLFLFSCAEEGIEPLEQKPESNALNKIMPLGASRVEGARPVFESYRYELWKRLVDDQWDFDYLGSLDDEANYPMYNSSVFDNDHEGRGGWTSGQILSGLEDWLALVGTPDIVLFSSPGGNDALQNLSYEEAIGNINSIIDLLQAKNPKVTIIIEQLAPARTNLMTQELQSYFRSLTQDVLKIAIQQSTENSKVIPVDMFSGFNDTFLADDVHYNEAGAAFIAERYYDVLQEILK